MWAFTVLWLYVTVNLGMETTEPLNHIQNLKVFKWAFMFQKDHWVAFFMILTQTAGHLFGTCSMAVYFIFAHLAVFMAITEPLQWDAHAVVALKLVTCTAILTASLLPNTAKAQWRKNRTGNIEQLKEVNTVNLHVVFLHWLLKLVK